MGGLIDKSTSSADQQFNARFMRMWQLAKDLQAKELAKGKKKKTKGLESKLGDSKLTGEQIYQKAMTAFPEEEEETRLRWSPRKHPGF